MCSNKIGGLGNLVGFCGGLGCNKVLGGWVSVGFGGFRMGLKHARSGRFGEGFVRFLICVG